MSQKTEKIETFGNLTIKGANLITMAQDATKQTSRNQTHKARVDSETMSRIIKEAKSMIFEHGVIYTTAHKDASAKMSPKETILFRQSSSKVNHPHLARVKVYSQQ